MPNSGVVAGADILLYKNEGTDAEPIWTAYAHGTTLSYSGSTAMRERADKDDGGATRIKPGRHGVTTILIAGLTSYDGSDFFALDQSRLNRERLQVKYSGRPAADTLKIDTVEAEGDFYYEAYGYISECGREDPTEGDSTYSATISLDGVPTKKTVGANV